MHPCRLMPHRLFPQSFLSPKFYFRTVSGLREVPDSASQSSSSQACATHRHCNAKAESKYMYVHQSHFRAVVHATFYSSVIFYFANLVRTSPSNFRSACGVFHAKSTTTLTSMETKQLDTDSMTSQGMLF